MERTELYRDIAERTQGDIYIGVVGPVRTGKSTFIKRFMELLVLPGIENDYERTRVTDELPQSGAGKTIMTTQPRFVPNEAVEIKIGDSARLNVRMVDCVGYMVKGALGFEEDSMPRMVSTPWSSQEIPFEQAAEIGTRKVITDHSTIGIVMTTDGSITDIPRSAYIEPEERVVNELKEQGKPFVVVLNSTQPMSEETIALRDALNLKYDVPVLAMDIMNIRQYDLEDLLESVLFEFPLKELHFEVPEWVQALPQDHYLIQEVMDAIRSSMNNLDKVRDYALMLNAFDECEHLIPPQISSIQLGSGEINYSLGVQDGLFYNVLSEECGTEINGEHHLISIIKELVTAKKEYDHMKGALQSVRDTGYGIIPPSTEELTLAEPEMIKRGNQYGVKLKATGPSLHLVKVDVNCEVSPVVGTEQQSEELVKYLLSEFETDPARIWKTDIFGKSLHELVSEGLTGKLTRMPEDARDKLQETLGKIINEGNGGLICIIL